MNNLTELINRRISNFNRLESIKKIKIFIKINIYILIHILYINLFVTKIKYNDKLIFFLSK
jgi:hypothetical protein